MAASDWLFSSLVASLKRRGNVPTSSESWTEADFRALADDEMRAHLVPLLRRLNEEFFVVDYDVTTTSATEYRLPPRATGEVLRDVQANTGGGFVSLVRADSREAASGGAVVARGDFYLRDDKVCFFSAPTAGDTLRLRYIMRPNKLVAESRVYEVTVKGTTPDVTLACLDGADNAQTFFGASATVDVIRAKPGFRHLALDVAATFSTTTGTLTTAAHAALEVGDYVCVAEESPVPQIPAEAHPLLAQSIVCAYLRAAGQPGLAEAEAKRADMEKDLVSLLTPRTQAQVRFVVNQHGPGLWIRRYRGGP